MKNLVLGLLAAVAVATVASAETVWVNNHDGDSISIIDPDTNEVVVTYTGSCELGGLSCVTDPTDIAFRPDGTIAYVLSNGRSQIVSLDTSGVNDNFDSPTLAGYADTPGSAQGIAVNDDGTLLFVTDTGEDAVYIYDIEDNPGFPYVEDVVNVGNGPDGIAVIGDTALVVNKLDDNVSFIDMTLDPPDVADTLSVGDAPERIIVGNISGVGVRAYTVNGNSDNVSVISVTSSPSIVTTVSVGDKPRGLTFYPNMGAILVANADGYSISKINTSNNTVSSFATSLSHKPFRLAITNDGERAYVSNPGPDKVSVFNAGTGEFTEQISVGYTPGSVAILADN